MKLTFIFLLLPCFHILSFAQIDSDVLRDTTLANEYLAQAELLDSLSIDLLHKAIKMYEKHQVVDKLIISKGLLAYLKKENTPEMVGEVYNLAEAAYHTDVHPTLLYANMAMQFFYERKNIKAIEYGQKAMHVVKKPSWQYFNIAFTLIGDYCNNYQAEEALKILEEVENFLEEDKSEHTEKFIVDVHRAHLQIKMLQTNFESAIIYGEKCIIGNEKYNRIGNRDLGTIFVDIGSCHFELGRIDKAIEWMKDGLKVADLPPEHPDISSYYGNLAFAYSVKKDNKTAIEYSKKAIEILTPYKELYAQSLRSIFYNTSVYYYELQDLENALKYIEDSYQFGESYHLYMHHANLLSEKGNYRKALKYAQKSIRMLSADFDAEDIEQNPSKYEIYSDKYWAGLALLSKSSGLYHLGVKENNPDYLFLAIEVSELAIHVIHDFIAQLMGYELAKMTHSKLISNALAIQVRANYDLYESNKEDQYCQNYFKAIERLKAMTLLQNISPSPLPKDIIAEEEALVRSHRLLAQKTETASEDSLAFFQNQLFEVNQGYEAFMNQLAKDFPKETRAFYNINYATIASVQNQLAVDELYIDYITMSEYLYISTISEQTRKLTKVAIDDQFLEALQTMQRLLKDPLLVQRPKQKSFIETSHYLYNHLIQPIASQLATKSKIIISPQKQLFFLPFETLVPTAEIKSFQELDFLVKKYEINYQYSATIYQQLKEFPPIKNNALLAFAPVFENREGAYTAIRSAEMGQDSLYRSIEGDHFIALPNSKKEVNTIAQILSPVGKAKVLLHQEATKKNLIEAMEAQPYQFLHVATHGLVNFQNPKLSALACYRKGEAEEGLVYANEIQLQNIQADLVVLSSCESGIGQLIQGEGLIALNRSFIYAGARNVLFSLWKVNDFHTSELMINFYKYYAQGASYSSALRSSKLKMLEDPLTANPRFWASFVLIGE